MLKDNLTKALAPLGLEQVADGDYAKTGYHLEVAARPQQMPDVAQAMLDQGCFLESLTAVDLRDSFTPGLSLRQLRRTVPHRGARQPGQRRPGAHHLPGFSGGGLV
ncbi:MAG: hypothetical protein ACHQ2F_07115 [Desulfobaccales bacterium]